MPATVTTKGQVTIPKSIRDRLGLKPGSRVVFSLDGEGRAVLQAEGVSGPSRSDRIDRLRGTAPAGLSTDEIMALTRGEPIQFDPHAPTFAEDARRQCLLANASAQAGEDQAFLDAISWMTSRSDASAPDVD